MRIAKPRGASAKASLVVMLFSISPLVMSEVAHAQKFPSCTNAEANEKIVSVLTHVIEKSGEGNNDVKLTSVKIIFVWPRNARYGKFSGILECEVTARAILKKISTGEEFVVPINKFALYFGYDQQGNFVVETPSGLR